MRRIAAGLVCFVLGEGLVHAQPPSAPSVSVEEFTGRTADPFIPKSLPELLENEMGRPLNACGGHIIEWRRRADIEREVDLARKGLIDPATAPREGRNMRPDVFVRGTVNGDSSYTWKIQLVAAVGGEILGEDSGTVPAQDLFEAVPQVATRLVRKLCEQRVGYAMDGVMDEATITGTICGTLDKPFTAVSPDVGRRRHVLVHGHEHRRRAGLGQGHVHADPHGIGRRAHPARGLGLHQEPGRRILRTHHGAHRPYAREDLRARGQQVGSAGVARTVCAALSAATSSRRLPS
jgi:hypothetical protein